MDQPRYLIFAGEFKNEPKGGMRDLQKRVRIKAEAVMWLDGFIAGRGSGSWGHVYDIETGEEVYAAEGIN